MVDGEPIIILFDSVQHLIDGKAELGDFIGATGNEARSHPPRLHLARHFRKLSDRPDNLACHRVQQDAEKTNDNHSK